MTVYLYPPPGATEVHHNGFVYRPNADGCIAVPDAELHDMLIAGCTRARVAVTTTTSKRPTIGLLPGTHLFDTSLNKPIWRNAANTQWVDATGATV